MTADRKLPADLLLRRINTIAILAMVGILSVLLAFLGSKTSLAPLLRLNVRIAGTELVALGRASKQQSSPGPTAQPSESADGWAQEFIDSETGAAGNDKCFEAGVTSGARIVGLGTYEGGPPVNVAFPGETHEVRSLAVQAEAKGPPLLLVLTAYDPVLWDFHGFPMERLRGVLVYGYADQAVAHLTAQVPVRFVTRRMDSSACGKAIYTYKRDDRLQQLRRQIRTVLGAPLDAFYGSYDPAALNADGAAFAPVRNGRSSPLIRSSTVIAASVRFPSESRHIGN